MFQFSPLVQCRHHASFSDLLYSSIWYGYIFLTFLKQVRQTNQPCPDKNLEDRRLLHEGPGKMERQNGDQSNKMGNHPQIDDWRIRVHTIGRCRDNNAAGRLLNEIPRQGMHTPGLYRHVSRPISFTLVVDDLGVKYVGKKHANHLVNVL